MNVARRAKDLQALLDLRLGLGAANLPPRIQRIDLNFAYKINDGHMGARKVWREILPRLKYHNPGVAMSVRRHQDHAGPSEMTITSEPQTPSSDMEIQVLDMKHKTHAEIFQTFMAETGATPYQATPQELAEVEEVAESNARRVKDRARQSQLNETIRHEALLLEQARNATA